MAWRDHIEIDPGRLGGKPVVRGSRIPVELVAELVTDGWSAERSRESYPTLSEEDIRACLRYAAAILREERRFPLPAA
ncbi:DUF433 domain-containing protein [Benzoatithermus flavus]|uniref:DUF433 domain-containing protein n=1 Tax=Benzoatithermus flavus TaxID=3108223 RepID=A0ABU8XS44_9PROT